MDQPYFFGEILLTVHIRNPAKQKQSHCLDFVMRLATVQCSTYKERQNMDLLRHPASSAVQNSKASDSAVQEITVIIRCTLFV